MAAPMRNPPSPPTWHARAGECSGWAHRENMDDDGTTTRGPPFVGRLEVDGMVWDCRATEVDLSRSLADERAWLRCLSGYADSGGSEWAGGETDSDDDYYFPSGGSDGDDRDAYD